ncbi:kinase-like protein [Schizophyllum amplum]|uniref:Kinase-like protein n=1 Tax=Schizophyllum amplum TaxID=97359 RepID=A0A550CQH3_9AGAR|nr:kinase-like protein [Auriculariopsis ampla]
MSLVADTFDESALYDYQDAELESYIANSPRIYTTRQEGIRKLSPQLAAKPVPWPVDPQDEVLALERARSAGVRAPVVHRVVPCEDEGHFLVMDLIKGATLEQIWQSMGFIATLRLAWQLRTYLRSMASVTSQTTGGIHSGHVESEWIQGQYGPIPHASPTSFSNYLNWWLSQCRPTEYRAHPELAFQPAPHHTLVHQDLAPRNMIVDAEGALWVVDWDHAGFYPPCMEYGGMVAIGHAMPWLTASTWTAWWGRLRWSFFRWVACGPGWRYTKQLKGLAVVRQRSMQFRLAKGPFSMKR